MKVVTAWSGGKDSCFAYFKAVKSGLDVISLVTFMQSEAVSNFHGIRSDLLGAQAKCINMPLVKKITTAANYEKELKDTLIAFKIKGVSGIVTGDIYEVANHEERWLERVCREIGYTPIRPLWQGNTTKIFTEFINSGFKATVVRTKLSLLGKEWLGRTLDMQFLEDILKIKGVDPCGEGGEYHTVMTDGPIFRQAIRLLETQKSSQGEFGRLEINKFDVTAK